MSLIQVERCVKRVGRNKGAVIEIPCEAEGAEENKGSFDSAD